jgi:hypothetical protein
MNKKEYLCKICNKNYASASSLWNHNNKFHNNILNNNVKNLPNSDQLLSTFDQPNVNIMSTSCQPNVNIISTPCQPNVNIMSNQCEPNINLICNNKINALQCKYCNKLYKFRQSKCRHEQQCKIKDNDNKKIEIDKLKYEIELLKNNNNNNQIITTNNNNNTNTKNSNNNSNNNNINNTINIVKFGSERLSEILNENEMLKITEFINNSVNESIKKVQ